MDRLGGWIGWVDRLGGRMGGRVDRLGGWIGWWVDRLGG